VHAFYVTQVSTLKTLSEGAPQFDLQSYTEERGVIDDE
jgi:hypothetical protein